MRTVYVDHLVTEHGGQRDIENGRWAVVRDDSHVDVSVIEDRYPPRVLVAALVTTDTDSIDLGHLADLEDAMPFGRISIYDDGLWVTERLHIDAVNPATFAHALDFVHWATGAVADQLDTGRDQRPPFGTGDAAQPLTTRGSVTHVARSGGTSRTNAHAAAGYL